MTPAPTTSNAPAAPAAPATPASGGSRLGRVLIGMGFGAPALVAGIMTLWATAALYYDFRVSWLRVPSAAAYPLLVLCVWIRLRGRWRKLALTAVAFAVVLAWWLTLKPSNNRDWQPDVAVLASADVNGNQVTVHNIRNCDYRTETEF